MIGGIAPDIGWLTILGLSDSAARNLGAVRAAQLSVLHRTALFRFAANMFAALLLIIAFREQIAAQTLYGWLALTIATTGFNAHDRISARHWADRSATLVNLHRETIGSLLTGLVWCIPIILFAPHADTSGLLALWAISAFLMAVSTAILVTVPVATITFLLLIGFTWAAQLAALGHIIPMVVTLCYTAILVVSAMRSGRAFVLNRVATLELSENKEVVSLLLREFEDENADWLWQTDMQGRMTSIAPRFAAALGKPAEELIGMTLPSMLLSASEDGNAAALAPLIDRLATRTSFANLIVPIDRKGEIRWLALSAAPKADVHGNFMGLRGVGSDVTAERTSADQINRLARSDMLTGLPNRLSLNEMLSRALEPSGAIPPRCAFLMIDLDRFKAVNDTLGHPLGDRLLGQVAARLNALMAAQDLCGRLGGDEFAVVIRNVAVIEHIDELAQAIIESLSAPYEVDGHSLYIGASIGIAVAPEDGSTPETLVRSADLALYRSKDAGGGRYHRYEPQLHADAEERRALESALHGALEAGQMRIVYQPVISTSEAAIEAFEALLRWDHPELGAVPPCKFIPVAEDTRLITRIGEWVLRTACIEAARWPAPIRVAVNVSPEQLNDPHFVSSVVSALSHSGLAPERLELEVTESIFLREGTGAINILDQVLRLGIRLTLDDFGTGYSALGYLRKTRFSTIKIDRSFVEGAARNNSESLAIIRAVVALAQSLGMSTTAEGAETEEEVKIARQLGCSKVQGYYFGHPMSPAHAAALVNQDTSPIAASA